MLETPQDRENFLWQWPVLSTGPGPNLWPTEPHSTAWRTAPASFLFLSRNVNVSNSSKLSFYSLADCPVAPSSDGVSATGQSTAEFP